MRKNKYINLMALFILVLPILSPMPTYAGVTEYQKPNTDMEESSMECEVIYKTTYDFSETIPKYPELDVSAYGYGGTYDGRSHGITVGCNTGSAVILYSSDGKTYTTKRPVYTDVGTYVTYFKVEKDGYAPTVSSATVKITEAEIEYEACDYNGIFDGRTHSIPLSVKTNGCKILYSTDGINYSSRDPEFKESGTYVVYYKISKDNFATVTGSVKVVIKSVDGSNQNNGDVSKVQTGDTSNILFYSILLLVSGTGLLKNEKRKEREKL